MTMDRYATSKLLLLMFMLKVKDVVDPNNVIVNMADPGTPKTTGLDRDMPRLLRVFGDVAKTFVGRPLQAAAWTYLDAAVVKGAESHGSYIYDWQISP